MHIFEQETNVTFTAQGFSPQLERQWLQTVHRTLEECGNKDELFQDWVIEGVSRPDQGMGWHLESKAAYTFGVIVGGTGAMTSAMRVVGMMWSHVDQCIKEGRPKVCAGCKRSNHGLDQGILNFMFYAMKKNLAKGDGSKLNPGFELVGHHGDSGLTTNVPCCVYSEQGDSGRETCRRYSAFMSDGRVRNRDGIVPIVHQHDRCPGLDALMARRDGFELPFPKAGQQPGCCAEGVIANDIVD